jgi:hypothetical protein
MLSFEGSQDILVEEKKYLYRFASLNDIHVGSEMGLFPPIELGFTTESGNQIVPSPTQRKLWEYFEDYLLILNRWKIQNILLVGDAIAGANPKECGRYVMPIELDEQVRACAFILNHLAENVKSVKNILVWSGSRYHDSLDYRVHKALVDVLKGEFKRNAVWCGDYSYIKLKIADKERVMFISHYASEALVYPETAMGQDIRFFEQAVAEGKVPKVDIIIRAHTHFFSEVHTSNMRAIRLPCWQCFIAYDRTMKKYPKLQPDIGGVVFLFDDESRLRVLHYLYSNIISEDKFLTL